jgi:hypothetical protein
LTIQDIGIRREGSQVFIDAVMADSGEPNLAVWNAGLKQIAALLTDPAVKDYHVRARYKPAAQVLFVAPQVPGLGYRTFWLLPRSADRKTPLRLGGLPVKTLLSLQDCLSSKYCHPVDTKPGRPTVSRTNSLWSRRGKTARWLCRISGTAGFTQA